MYDTLNPQQKARRGRALHAGERDRAELRPGAGDRFYVLDDISQARQLAEQRAADARQRDLAGGRPHVTLETLYERLGEESKVQTLNIILRADVRGSIEAIRKELSKLQHAEVQIKILQATVGGITEADVHLAHASDAVIIGFSVVPDEGARALADKLGVQIRRYDIIYQVTDDLRAALEGMLKPERQEKDLGRALVQQDLPHQPGGKRGRLPRAGRRHPARRPRASDPREPGDRRLRPRFAEAREGRRPRGPRGLRMRHQVGRIQRHQGRRPLRGLQDRGDRENVLVASGL